MTVSHISLPIDGHDSFDEFTVKVFCSISLIWVYPEVFLMLRLKLWVLGGGQGEGPSTSHRVKDTYNHVAYYCDVDLDHLAEVVLVRFLLCKVSLPPAFHTVLFGRKSLHKPHLKSRELCSTSFRVEYLYKLFGILLHKKFV